jgi:hypothetical protein
MTTTDLNDSERPEPPTLDAYRSPDGIHLNVWCQHCREWHEHTAHVDSPDCHMTSTGRSPCTCPLGSADGPRVAHCHDRNSPCATRASCTPGTCSARSARLPRRSSAPRTPTRRPALAPHHDTSDAVWALVLGGRSDAGRHHRRSVAQPVLRNRPRIRGPGPVPFRRGGRCRGGASLGRPSARPGRPR